MGKTKHYINAASWREWAIFLVLGLVGCIGIGLRYVDYQKLRQEEEQVAARHAKVREFAAKRERAVRRMTLDKGREIEIRKRGYMKPGERPLPPITSPE